MECTSWLWRVLILFIAALGVGVQARDLAGMPWEDFSGLSVYAIPAALLYDLPKEWSEKRQVRRLFEDGYHLREVVV